MKNYRTPHVRKLPADARAWFEFAINYCAKRETSRPKLRRYLVRKMKECKPDEESLAKALIQIESALDECERLKIIDHERFAGMLTREYARRGKGTRYVIQQLHAKGLKEEIPNMEVDPEKELERAVDLVNKQLTRSVLQKIDNHWDLKKKLTQKLLASGFELSIAKKAIELACPRDYLRKIPS